MNSLVNDIVAKKGRYLLASSEIGASLQAHESYVPRFEVVGKYIDIGELNIKMGLVTRDITILVDTKMKGYDVKEQVNWRDEK